MSDIKEHLVVFFAGAFTIVMLTFGFLYGSLHYSEDNGIAEMGAFIAGIFAPVIWVWFLASYTLQSNELKLQREELKLQRQALEKQVEELGLNREELSLQREELGLQRKAIQQSTLAQQGSEQALKEQSEVLAKQLKLNSQQYEYAIEQRINNKPKFILPEISLNSLEKTNMTRPDIFRCSLSIVNIGSDAKIRMIEVFIPNESVQAKLSEDQNTIELSSSINLGRLTRQKLTNAKIPSDKRRDEYGFYRLLAFRDTLLSCELHIFYYSDKTGAGSDKYIFKIIDNIVNMSVNSPLLLP